MNTFPPTDTNFTDSAFRPHRDAAVFLRDGGRGTCSQMPVASLLAASSV